MNIAGCINMDTHIAAVYSSFPWCGHSPDPIACIDISVCSYIAAARGTQRLDGQVALTRKTAIPRTVGA